MFCRQPLLAHVFNEVFGPDTFSSRCFTIVDSEKRVLLPLSPEPAGFAAHHPPRECQAPGAPVLKVVGLLVHWSCRGVQAVH
jgi:hypothetical protein